LGASLRIHDVDSTFVSSRYRWYTTAYCFSIAEGFILADPNGWCLALQNRLKRNYPDDLVRSIVLTNRAVMGGRILSGYFEQIQAAISRDDIVSVNHRVAAFLASYYDILFAVNRRYHPGEKRLLQYGNELEIIPENAMANVRRLCQLAGRADESILTLLAEMLQTLDNWLKEMGWTDPLR
jgi:hypothetical protein